MRPVVSNLPFQVTEQTTVSLKELPVLHCENCGVCLIADAVPSWLGDITATVDNATQLEILQYVA